MAEANNAYLNFIDFGSIDFYEHFSKIIVPDSKLIVVKTGSVYDTGVVASIKSAKFDHPVLVNEADQSEIQSIVAMIRNDFMRNIVVLLESNPDRLSALLHAFIDRPAFIIAQTTSRYCCGNGLFVNSIPKAGTHLLHALLHEFGLKGEGAFSGQMHPHHWYDPGNIGGHVSAQSFFSTLLTEEYGGYYHQLFYTPKLFLYRNPLAILVSQARYLGEQGNHPLNHYMQPLSLDCRIDELIGLALSSANYATRTLQFAPWLMLPNVIPISFEELVGPTGDGSEQAQFQLIWSLQLKLHIPGSPVDFCNRLKNCETATLRIGTIGSFTKYLLDRHIQSLRLSDQEFMRRFGYELDDKVSAGYLPRMVDEFRLRPLVLGTKNGGKVLMSCKA